MYLSYVNSYQIINKDKPICATCKYFTPSTDLSKERSIKYGKCTYYGEKNVYDGKVSYEYATIARKYKCGIDGLSYVFDKNYKWKYADTYLQPLLVMSPFIILISIYYSLSLS